MKGAGDKMFDKATTGLAGAWLASPIWYDGLQTASEVAALIVPILSAAWLAFKLYRAIADWRGGRASNE